MYDLQFYIPHMLLPDDSMNSVSRSNKRIRVACDLCRRKKIKCNGEYPCGNCLQSKGSTCHYEERSLKKKHDTHSVSKQSTRSKNTKSIEVLNSRLSTLEDVILKLTDKIDIIGSGSGVGKGGATVPIATFKDKTGGAMPLSKRPYALSDLDDGLGNRSGSSDTNSEDDDDMTASENEHTTQNINYDSAKMTHGNPAGGAGPAPGATGITGETSNSYLSRSSEQYFGTHTSMCIFSDKSLEWIQEMLGEGGKRYINPVRNMPTVFLNKFRPFMLKWIDPPAVDLNQRRKLLERPFPNDPRVVFGLIDAYHNDVMMLEVLVETSSLRCMFQDYFKNLEAPVYGQPLKRRFKLSEYLIMSMSLLLCLTSKTDGKRAKSRGTRYEDDHGDPLAGMTAIEVSRFKDTLLDNAIYYYQRLTVMSDGIETIQGILLLLVYVETSWISSSLNYMLSTIAIRYAQQIGLHRSETYELLSEEEQMKRKRLWWFCHYFDMEICFRTGKPPLINASDVTTDNELDPGHFPESRPEATGNPKPYSYAQEMLKNPLLHENSTEVMNIFFFLLTRIRSRSYSQLFVASVQKTSYETLADRLDHLNNEMFSLASSMSEDQRPRFWNDPQFLFVPSSVLLDERQAILGVFLGYFLQLMTMNRLPFLNRHEETIANSERNHKYRNLSNAAARTILVLVRQMNPTNCTVTFYNWIVFYPVSAFINLFAGIISHPDDPEAYDDIKLMADSSMNFFETTDRLTFPRGDGDILKVYSEKDAFIGLLMKLVLRIAIRFYEIRMNVDIIKDFPGMKEHLDAVESTFPDLFNDRATFTQRLAVAFKNRRYESQMPAFRTTSNYVPLSKASMNSSSPNPHSPSFNPTLSNIIHPQDAPRAGLYHGGRTSFKPPSHLPKLPPTVAGTPVNSQVNPLPSQPQLQSFPVEQQYPQCQAYSQSDFAADPSLHNIQQDLDNGGEFFTDYLGDDNFTSNFYSQLYNLPNFMLDSNLGT